MFFYAISALLFSACTQPTEAPTDPFEVEALPTEQAGPPTLTLDGPAYLEPGATITVSVDGLVQGERAYLGASLVGQGPGPCLAAAGGLCLNIRGPVRLIGQAVAGPLGIARVTFVMPALPYGTRVSMQGVVIRGPGGALSAYAAPLTLPVAVLPPEGLTVPTWTPMPFADDGYRDGCAGGLRYVKSTGYATADYVGVTLCDDDTYKIWLSDAVRGTFHSAGDWSGTGEDHCDFVGGVTVDMPQGSTAVDPGESCWSRGNAGAAPTYEATCTNNRWIAPAHTCNISIPSGALTGPPEGATISDWTAFAFQDDGYRNGCAGGEKYIKSTGFADPAYVGVTLCDDTTYKIQLSDTVYGTFVSAGDWSGLGEDLCDYVDGAFIANPQGSTAVSGGASCWSRGNAGATPAYEATCLNNRWIPPASQCNISLPSGDVAGPAEGAALPDWTAFDFTDNGYRDGCVGGAKYIKSTDTGYVGVTLCDTDTYKIWLSDTIWGVFQSAADSAGQGEDQCAYVGGVFVDLPQGSTAVDPAQSCWSRGQANDAPAWQAVCTPGQNVAPAHTCDVSLPAGTHPGPEEGDVLTAWTPLAFHDDAYADGCAGGAQYVKSTPYGTPGYVGVTLCDDDHYKIRLSDALYGAFVSAGDWSGTGEDQCEYVGGVYRDMPQGSAAVAAGESCWSRGATGATPAFEQTCTNNRWVAPEHWCSTSIPSGLPTGPNEGANIRVWTRFDFTDDGYRDDCPNGARYIRSAMGAGVTDMYVGVSVCRGGDTYKIWLSDTVYGTFHGAADWSGTGQDHCDYVGGTWAAFTSPSLAVSGGAACWSRGASGTDPVFEPVCANNRWVPAGYDCQVSIP